MWAEEVDRKPAANAGLLIAQRVSFEDALFGTQVPKIAADAVLLMARRVSEEFFVSVFFQGF